MNTTIFDFNIKSDLCNWKIVDDIVMGGKSQGDFKLNDDGNAVFSGDISLENNGGFSSVRYQNGKIELKENTKIVIKLKGDLRKYQFRIKERILEEHFYSYDFITTNDWQEVEIPVEEMYPIFRGRKLNKKNFSGTSFEEIRFLIANKKNEFFKLEITKIYLK